MIKRLRAKFIVVNMTLMTVMLIVIFCLIFGFTRESLRRESLRMMETIGQAPLELFAPDERRDQVNLPYFVLQIDILGNITGVSGGYYDLSDREFLTETLKYALQSGENTGEIGAYQLRFLRVDARMGQRFVFADMSSEQATLADQVKIMILVGVAAFGAFFALSFWLSGWAVRPVEQAWSQQKQFVADASHELKTPLTVILTNAELLRGEECTDSDRARFSGSILVMAQQMRALVERLLTLARMDNNASNMKMEPLDLAQLTQERILPFEPVYFEHGLTLESQITDGLWITGSREHLSQVLDILLDNAMKYSDVPGTVRLCLKKQGKECLLTLSNPSPDFSREELDNLFKRFYRGDKARTRDGGYGLGLPIAMSIVTEHGGRLRAESAGGTVTFSLSLELKNG